MSKSTLSFELRELTKFIAENTDKDGDISRVNLTFVYRRLQAITARAQREENETDSDHA